jgi:thiol:disulfide interchange protein
MKNPLKQRWPLNSGSITEFRANHPALQADGRHRGPQRAGSRRAVKSSASCINQQLLFPPAGFMFPGVIPMKSLPAIRRAAASGAALLLAVALTGCQTAPETAGPAGNKPFDERARGGTLFDDALNRAQAENKRVLLLFGANWCPYCKALSGLLESDPEIRQVVARSYVVAHIDVGSSGRNRNTALVDRHDAPVFTDGIPALVITDARGRRLAPGAENPWSVKDSLGADRVLAFLRRGAE